MPVRAICPECGATTIIDEDISKKAVACAQCGKQVPVPAAKSAGPPPVPKKEVPADAGGFEVLDGEVQPEPARIEAAAQSDEEEVDDRPPVGRPSRRGDEDDEDEDRPSGRSRRYADDDEDDRPRGRSRRDDDEDEDDEDEDDEDDDRARGRSRDDDDEYEDDEDRPRRRSRNDDDDEDDLPRGRSRSDDDDDDEEDDDELPTARSRRDADDEDEDDEDEDRPRMRSRQDDDEEDEDDDEPRARSRQDEDDEEDDEDEGPRSRTRRDEDDEDDDEDDVVRGEADDDEDDEDAPVRVRLSRDEDDDEDDEDDLPVRYSGSDDDDDEDEDSIPRRRPSDRDEAEQRSGKKGLILIGLLMLLLVGAAGGAAAYFLTQDDKKVAKNDGDKPPPDDQPPVDPKVPDPKVPDPKVPDRKVPDPKLVDVPGLAIRPVSFAGERKSIPLPGKPADIRAGGDGRYLFLHCPDDKKLLVYDCSDASLVRELPSAGKDAAFAAGAGKLILVDNTNRTIQRYDLTSLEKDKEGPFPFGGRIDELSLGAGSNGPALVVTTPPGAWPVEFLDVETLAKADIGWKVAPAADLPRVTSFSAAANGSRWAGIPAGPNALGAVIVTREGKQISADLVASDKNLGYVALSADGQSMCSRLGTTNTAASVARVPTADGPSFVTPAVSGNLFVHVFDGKSIALTTTANPPSPKGQRTDVPTPYAPGDKMTPDRHIHLVPEAKALVICPSGPENKLEVIKFDPVAAIPPSTILVTSTPPDAFRPGSRFAYKVRTLASIPERSYELSGPKGAIQQNGVVAWNVPADEKQESVRFRLTVRAPGRQAFDQTFTVYSTAAPAPKTDPPKKDPKIDTKSPDPKTPTVTNPSNIAPGVKLVQESSGRLPITAPEMKDPHVEVELPGPIRDACVAGGGRFLIFHCASKRKIAIFDVNTLKIEKQITLNSDDVLFAASMEKLLIIYPDEKVVIRYSLASFKPETDINLEVRQRPNAAAMGSATAGPLILGGVPAQNNASNMVLTFLDLDTMKEVAIDKAEGDFKVKFGAAANLRVSADGRTLGAWYMNLRPSGLQIARLAGNTIGGSYVAETVGHVTPGPDGQTLFTEKGMYTTKGEPTGKREAAVPAVHGNWFVTLAPNAKGPEGAQRVSVWEAGKTVPLAERDDLPGFDGKRDPFERDNPTLALDRRLFLVPEAKILVVVPPAANKLHVYRVDAGKK